MTKWNKDTYAQKLKDPRWQKVRLKVLERDGFACRHCGSTTETLHVHHLMYAPGDPWDTPTDDLLTLCWICHENETEHRKRLEERLLVGLRRAWPFDWIGMLGWCVENMTKEEIMNGILGSENENSHTEA